MKKIFMVTIVLAIISGCSCERKEPVKDDVKIISNEVINSVLSEMKQDASENDMQRLEKGVKQSALLWRAAAAR